MTYSKFLHGIKASHDTWKIFSLFLASQTLEIQLIFMKIRGMVGQKDSRSRRVISGNLRETSGENIDGRQYESDAVYTIDEAFTLHSSDHPGMTLVLAPLNGDNYLSLSRYVKIALGAKNKLNFIDGTPSPKMDSPWYVHNL